MKWAGWRVCHLRWLRRVGETHFFYEFDLGIKKWGEDDVRLGGVRVFLGEAAGDGRSGGGIAKGGVEAFASRRRVLTGKSKVRLAGMRVLVWRWVIGIREVRLRTACSITGASCLLGFDLAIEKAVSGKNSWCWRFPVRYSS